MFGMGFTEILLIAVIAIIALGPEKLPNAMVEIAKFIKKLKSGVEEAKSTLDNELNISEMKEEAQKFKAQIENTKSTFTMDNKDLGLDGLMIDEISDDKPKKKKKKKKKEKTLENTPQEDKEVKEKIEKKENSQNKFKVNFDKKEEDK